MIEHNLFEMENYRELIDEGLACPMEVEKDEDGDYNDVAVYYSTQDMADQNFFEMEND